MRIYTLFPTPSGFSNKTVDYHGVEWVIAAASIKQAYYFAYNRMWSKGPDNPSGVIQIYERGFGDPGDHLLWDGCRIFGGVGLDSGEGMRAIVAAMRAHLQTDH